MESVAHGGQHIKRRAGVMCDGRVQDLVGRKSNQSDRSTAIDFYFFNYGRQYFYFINHTKIKSKIDFYFWRQKLARRDGVMMAEETSFERQDDEIPF
jgi:hypothetical protein